MTNLTCPDLPKPKKYTELITLLKKYMASHASTITTHVRSQFIHGVYDRDMQEKNLLQLSSKISFEDALRSVPDY